MNTTEQERVTRRPIRIMNIHQGRARSASPDSPLHVYAEAREADSGALVMSALLSDVLRAAEERGWLFVKA